MGSYHEPFLGSGSLFFNLSPEESYLNDTNAELINTFNVVKKHPTRLYNIVEKMPITEFYYYQIRSSDPEKMGKIDRAARFVYLNRNCFNGIYRTNKSGNFNVPFSGIKTGTIPDKSVFLAASKALENSTLTCTDFEEAVLSKIKRNDFVYLDPPYMKSNTRIFREYGPEIFTDFDFERLCFLAKKIDSMGSFFLLSSELCEKTISIFESYNIFELESRRTISSDPKHRKRIKELLISNIEPRSNLKNKEAS